MAFKTSEVLEHNISEAQLKTFYIGFDLGVCRMEAFSDILMDAIVDFAFGYHTGILTTYDRRKLIEAARSIYKIDSFAQAKWTYVDEGSVIEDDDLKAEDVIKKRGEFGELILHVILRDYFNTTPLMSKIFFKDTDGFTVHGFDSVHIGPDLPDCKAPSLYLGESKIYYRKDGSAGKSGISDLLDDIKTHFKTDLLRRELVLLAKKKYSFTPIEEYSDQNTKSQYEDFLVQKRHWFEIFDKVGAGTSKLEDFLESVTIPLVCTYQSKIFEKCDSDNHPDFSMEYEKEIRELEAKFNELKDRIKTEAGEPIATNLNIILILFPIPSKKELIRVLHQKLYNQQNA